MKKCWSTKMTDLLGYVPATILVAVIAIFGRRFDGTAGLNAVAAFEKLADKQERAMAAQDKKIAAQDKKIEELTTRARAIDEALANERLMSRWLRRRVRQLVEFMRENGLTVPQPFEPEPHREELM